MIVTKHAYDQVYELTFDKIKDYARYSMYQVSKVINGVKIPIYRECFSPTQINEIENNKYIIIQVENDG